jgi:hypothetical protein
LPFLLIFVTTLRLSQNFSFWESNPDFIRAEGLISPAGWQLEEMILAPLQSGAELYPAL